MMKDKKIKKRWLIVFSVILILILVAFFAIYLPWKHKAKAPVISDNTNTTSEGGIISDANQNSSFDQKDANTPAPSNTTPAPTNSSTSSTPADTGTTYTPNNSADSFYYLALKNMTDQNYPEAISNFSKAIAIDPKQVDYYSKKAEAQVLAGDKNGAIATVEAGLVALPGNELLQNKLDIIKATVK